MTKCCVLWCNARQNKNRPQLTLHQLPRNKAMQKKWLDIIGSENINQDIKRQFVCSLHFEEACFNRTLDVIRLRDGAVPSFSLCRAETTVLNKLRLDLVATKNPLLMPSTSSTHDVALNQDAIEKTLPLPSTSLIQQQSSIPKALQKKYLERRKKIKSLTEKVRRRDTKVAHLTSIIEYLEMAKLVDNEEALLQEDCASPGIVFIAFEFFKEGHCLPISGLTIFNDV